jgi:hypothetical protein
MVIKGKRGGRRGKEEEKEMMNKKKTKVRENKHEDEIDRTK